MKRAVCQGFVAPVRSVAKVINVRTVRCLVHQLDLRALVRLPKPATAGIRAITPLV
jgi:hypothetical protein